MSVAVNRGKRIEREREVCLILERYLDQPLNQSAFLSLRDGELLAQLALVLDPSLPTSKVRGRTKTIFQQADNIDKFMRSLRTIGVPDQYFFTQSDLQDEAKFFRVSESLIQMDSVLQKKRLEESQNYKPVPSQNQNQPRSKDALQTVMTTKIEAERRTTEQGKEDHLDIRRAKLKWQEEEEQQQKKKEELELEAKKRQEEALRRRDEVIARKKQQQQLEEENILRLKALQQDRANKKKEDLLIRQRQKALERKQLLQPQSQPQSQVKHQNQNQPPPPDLKEPLQEPTLTREHNQTRNKNEEEHDEVSLSVFYPRLGPRTTVLPGPSLPFPPTFAKKRSPFPVSPSTSTSAPGSPSYSTGATPRAAAQNSLVQSPSSTFPPFTTATAGPTNMNRSSTKSPTNTKSPVRPTSTAAAEDSLEGPPINGQISSATHPTLSSPTTTTSSSRSSIQTHQTNLPYLTSPTSLSQQIRPSPTTPTVSSSTRVEPSPINPESPSNTSELRVPKSTVKPTPNQNTLPHIQTSTPAPALAPKHIPTMTTRTTETTTGLAKKNITLDGKKEEVKDLLTISPRSSRGEQSNNITNSREPQEYPQKSVTPQIQPKTKAEAVDSVTHTSVSPPKKVKTPQHQQTQTATDYRHEAPPTTTITTTTTTTTSSNTPIAREPEKHLNNSQQQQQQQQEPKFITITSTQSSHPTTTTTTTTMTKEGTRERRAGVKAAPDTLREQSLTAATSKTSGPTTAAPGAFQESRRLFLLQQNQNQQLTPPEGPSERPRRNTKLDAEAARRSKRDAVKARIADRLKRRDQDPPDSTSSLVPNKLPILQALADCFGPDTCGGWVVCGYPHENDNVVVLQASGLDGGVHELRQHLAEDQVQYALVRVADDRGGLVCYLDVFISWTGPRMSRIKAGKKQAHVGDMQTILAPNHAQLTASGLTNFNERMVRMLAHPSVGSHHID
eukprot:TRINITY_DN328_c0_g1_i1.p1 TRINITY_DN328_c0_g1~~TRINITY_DN328_c0_g1_i1.p1  ORF type:complete len:954 (+),score=218.66 TRINITY_DN328_c0_g1_i1:21-2882(+)